MTEFKVIPNAPDYEVNSEKEIRRVENKKPVFVLNGGKVLLKTADGGMEHFQVDEVVEKLFCNKVCEDTISEFSGKCCPCPDQEGGNTCTNESEDNYLVKEDVVSTNIDATVKRGRGRPRKPVDPNAPVKVKGTGKRGRPAGSKNKAK